MQAVYERYARALIRKAQRIVRRPEVAEDIVHGLFTDMMHAQALPAASLDLPYLYRSVTNRCLTYLRDEGNRARLLEDRALVAERTSCRVEERYMDLEITTRLFAELDDDTCRILVFRFFDDMSLDEIAETMKMARKTVAKRIELVRERIDALGRARSAKEELRS